MTMTHPAIAPQPAQAGPTLPKSVSDKFRFWSFAAMALLVFVHGYNLEPRYLQPWTAPDDVLGVTTFIEYFLANAILRFRIPLLFLISGYLFALHDQPPHRERIAKRVRTLLLPYLLWSGLALLLFYAFETWAPARQAIEASNIAQVDQEGTRRLVHDYHWYEWLLRWILFPLPYQLWFIRVLFFYNLAYPLLRSWVTGARSRRIFFAVAALLWLSSLPPLIALDGEGLLFFSLGVALQKWGFDIEKPVRWLRPRPWALVFVGCAAIKTVLAFEGPALLGDAVYPLLLLLHKVTVFSGLVTAWFGSDALVRWCMSRRWFVWLCSFSFIIYAAHAPLVAVAIDPFFELLGQGPAAALLNFLLLPLVIIGFAVTLGALLRWAVPSVYGVLTGGRGT
jgi:fucose 4-O-acetylase-like acetyltransferase